VRRERREKRAERVAGGKNLIISLGIPSGPGALHVPNELRLLSNVSRVIRSARVREGSPRGSVVKLSGLLGSSHGGMGRSCGVARLSSVAK
jgi:hypothetical protein